MNYNNIFAFVRKQKAFTAFMTTLVVVGSFSAAFAARGASAETVLLNVTDTLATSKPGVQSTQTVKFTLVNPVNGDATAPFTIDFPASFAVPAFTFSDVSMTAPGETYTAAASCGAAGTYTVSVSAETVTVMPCTGTIIPAGKVLTIVLGTGATKITNAGAAGAYDVIIDHAATNQSQKIQIMLISDVHVTAVVDPIFTFTVSGTSTGTGVNGTTTNITTTDTAIDFLTLVPGVAKVAAQDLRISTNARNGFNVTARTDSEFISANGATIDGFNYSGASSTASVWTTPLGTLNDDRTWGNIGLTTSDLTNTLPSAASNVWVGNFIQNPVTVFSQASSTRDQHVQVGYQVQITDLQEAATDYQTNVVYVATPVF